MNTLKWQVKLIINLHLTQNLFCFTKSYTSQMLYFVKNLTTCLTKIKLVQDSSKTMKMKTEKMYTTFNLQLSSM